MQPGNGIDCAFCQHGHLKRYTLKETPTFLVVTDHAPLVAGHILIIPRNHYTCYGDVPADLDAELLTLKQTVRQFFARFYAAPVFWEHGIFHQTVFHAHLHCFPFGEEIRYDLASGLHERLITSQDDLRAWHRQHNQYFYLEDSQHGVLFQPEIERYRQIIQQVLWPGVSTRITTPGWRSPQQRQQEGQPLIAETIARWRTFEQQGEAYADEQPRTR
ncbi:MAG: HIT family protein [Ktedonobacteraceae bacterium]|nr:HIT family protein [Ktedonobacteraceae bacterium]